MIRVVTGGLIVLPFVGLLSATAAAATEFEDIPFLQVRINQVLENEPTGAEVEWRNEATGNSGMIRVLKTYFPEPGAPCRDYERSTREPDGSETRVRGTGCRDASGRWNLKEKEDSEAPGSGAAAPSGGHAGSTGGPAGAKGETTVETGGTGPAAATGSPGAGQPTSVAPKQSQTEAASEAAAGASTAAAEKPAEPAEPAEPSEPAKPSTPAKPSEPSPPDYDLPTRSD